MKEISAKPSHFKALQPLKKDQQHKTIFFFLIITWHLA